MASISSVGSGFATGAGSILGTITSISIGGVSASEIEVTTITSTFKEYVLGTTDGGTVDLSMNLDAGVLASLPTAGQSVPTAFNVRFGTAGASVSTLTVAPYTVASIGTTTEANWITAGISGAALVTGGAFTVGTTFRIVTVGTTDYTLIGAINNVVGTQFTATGVGAGTGTASNVFLGRTFTGVAGAITGTGTAKLNSTNVPAFGFNAFIQKSSFDAGVDKQVTASYTLRISSAVAVTFAYA